MPRHGSAIWTMLTPAISRLCGMHAQQLRASREADALAGERQLARLRRLEREAERLRVGDRVPHAAERDVDGERPCRLNRQRLDANQTAPAPAEVACRHG